MVLLLLFVAPPWAFALLIVVASGLGAAEFYPIMVPQPPLLLRLAPVLSSLVVAAFSFLPLAPPLFLALAVLLPLLPLVAHLCAPGDLAGLPLRTGSLALGLLYTGLLPSFIVLVHTLPDHGPRYIILLFTITFLGDTGAYAAGRLFGRHRLYARLSPKKTWEGALGGILASMGAAALAHAWYLPHLPLAQILPVGALVGALGQMGDLCESMLKRANSIKDSGKLLPGHGGLLDRIDALLFAAPTFYLYLLLAGYGPR
jgi:phosphatidate cytidylyltransferase